MSDEYDIAELLKQLNEIGIALSAEHDHDRLMELILFKAMDITNADGGTLYTRTDDNKLKFEIVNTRSLSIHKGGTSNDVITYYPVSIYDEDGEPNQKMVAACAVHYRTTINIEDAYATDDYDFSGMRQFDKKIGYRSKSFLTVPMMNHEKEIIGVLQLINKVDKTSQEVVEFTELDQHVVESLSSQAAVTLTNQRLIDAQRELFNAFIQLIANAIDEKSPYTGGHCRRVPELTNMLARATCKTTSGPLKDFAMNDEEMYELEVAGWLHDCGKITTPEYVVDKATKLETIYDRIETVDTRFEVLKRDAMLTSLYARLSAKQSMQELLAEDEALQSTLKQLDEEREFIRTSNVGGESMSDEDISRIENIAKYRWENTQGENANLLSEEELKNLIIRRGTLTHEEREVINNHMVVTIDMLESLPYPKHLQRVPEYAGGHHEKMDGTGFPKGLTREQMSIPARMMAIADIFEALTASDRPYKKAMPISQALRILGNMKLNNHIDPDLFDVFIKEKVYMDYAKEFLADDQVDEIDLQAIPGYQVH